MIAISLAAALALFGPAPESLLPQEVPYASVAAAVSNQARTLNDQDTALFRQGLAAARARDILGARNAASQIGDPVAAYCGADAGRDLTGDAEPTDTQAERGRQRCEGGRVHDGKDSM